MVAPPRLELGRPCDRWILNPLRLPFRQEAIALRRYIKRASRFGQLSFNKSKDSRMLKRKGWVNWAAKGRPSMTQGNLI